MTYIGFILLLLLQCYYISLCNNNKLTILIWLQHCALIYYVTNNKRNKMAKNCTIYLKRFDRF